MHTGTTGLVAGTRRGPQPGSAPPPTRTCAQAEGGPWRRRVVLRGPSWGTRAPATPLPPSDGSRASAAAPWGTRPRGPEHEHGQAQEQHRRRHWGRAGAVATATARDGQHLPLLPGPWGARLLTSSPSLPPPALSVQCAEPRLSREEGRPGPPQPQRTAARAGPGGASAGCTPPPAASPAPARAPGPARSAPRTPPARPAPRSGSPGG